MYFYHCFVSREPLRPVIGARAHLGWAEGTAGWQARQPPAGRQSAAHGMAWRGVAWHGMPPARRVSRGRAGASRAAVAVAGEMGWDGTRGATAPPQAGEPACRTRGGGREGGGASRHLAPGSPHRPLLARRSRTWRGLSPASVAGRRPLHSLCRHKFRASQRGERLGRYGCQAVGSHVRVQLPLRAPGWPMAR
eukprot:scaffold2261_cov405-Prasinococcus_capsulatus_cf.AAC.41